jgi:hypothetical protein
MGELERKLIQQALKKHQKIFPCSRKGGFKSSFTHEKGRVLFWYNTNDQSTHVISAKAVRSDGARR